MPRRSMLAALAAAVTLPAGATAHTRLPGGSESASEDISRFHKWNRMLARHRLQESGDYSRFATGKAMRTAQAADRAWRRLLQDFTFRAPSGMSGFLHETLGALPYVSDFQNYGETDLWNTPRELFANGGDCEDYAIACFHALSAVAPDCAPRVVVLESPALPTPHAVCSFRDKGRMHILDWLTGPRFWREEDDYVYSIDHHRWWRPVN